MIAQNDEENNPLWRNTDRFSPRDGADVPRVPSAPPTPFADLPRAVRKVLHLARQRYRATPRNQRPGLNPTSLVGFFSLGEARFLTNHSVIPWLPPYSEWLAADPDKARQRRQRQERRIRALVKEVLAEELPEAVGVLLAQAPGVSA